MSSLGSSQLLPNDRRGSMIGGIIQVLKSGGRWIDAPEVYGPRKTLYNGFVRWAAKGVWVDIFHALAIGSGRDGGSRTIRTTVRQQSPQGYRRADNEPGRRPRSQSSYWQDRCLACIGKLSPATCLRAHRLPC
jgi:transposase